MAWPANPFWDYALQLYGREGVEAACLELQERHGLDVNVVLLCCWLANRGIEAEPAWLKAVVAAIQPWHTDVVRPLRAVRRRLKEQLAEPQSGDMASRWPELIAGLRQRVLGLEIDGERLEQLLLAELASDLEANAEPTPHLALRNLCRYRSFSGQDRPALAALLGAAFPQVADSEVAVLLDRPGR